jgi:hypothetical protein
MCRTYGRANRSFIFRRRCRSLTNKWVVLKCPHRNRSMGGSYSPACIPTWFGEVLQRIVAMYVNMRNFTLHFTHTFTMCITCCVYTKSTKVCARRMYDAGSVCGWVNKWRCGSSINNCRILKISPLPRASSRLHFAVIIGFDSNRRNTNIVVRA